ncbi:MAG: tyrosine-type recombinase/integrase [Bdellovibrionales bacterium]|nr:tyrosine-type recombinase/integrase [Bdellovibrionales bacterium]
MNPKKSSTLILEEEFLGHVQFNLHYSQNTVAAYKRDLSLYGHFQKTNRDIKDFYQFLTKRNLGARSQARVVSSVRSYLRFLQTHGHEDKAEKIKHLIFPKMKAKLPKLLTLDEFKALWIAAQDKGREEKALTLRNRLVLSFLYGLGCRVSELISLNLKDFNETESWINITGKGNHQRVIPLSEDLYESVRIYLKKSRTACVPSEKPWLIFNNKGNRPSRVDIWRWLKIWSLRAGFEQVKNPHSFRHGCATILLEKGADLKSIQQLLGHLNLQTTQIYTSVVSGQIKQTISQHHPLSKKKVSFQKDRRSG